MTVQEAIREILRVRGVSQERLARELGVSLRSVARWVTKDAPTGIHLLRLGKMAREHGLTAEADLLAGLHAEQLAAAADSLGLTGEQMLQVRMFAELIADAENPVVAKKLPSLVAAVAALHARKRGASN
jgi:transcriptional regulator with XRE-family HTH domain